ncbi:MAG: Sir2 histone deacetylase Hst2 [Vezdaea aestivalis]|nr:MAG: Sir2 histone deacetylase Hst2 [Vezdaea aestivalis]
MGADMSATVQPDEPPNVLKARDLESIASYISSGAVKNIVVMLGAGVSTASGIPDFRSPDSGLYSQLARLDLPHPEAVFDLSFFRTRPQPFYTLARELYPGSFTPSYTHAFIASLARRGLLYRCFTQNIDCLERLAGVPPELIVEAHGSFKAQRCIDCGVAYPDELMKRHVRDGEVPICQEEGCEGFVKPDIVFFGEALPEAFFEAREAPTQADLCLVLGTSLSVQPFASLPAMCGEKCPRVLVNKERVGRLGGRVDDVLVLGDCDEGVRELVELLGWEDEVDEGWRAVGGKPEARKPREEMSGDEKHDQAVERLVKLVDRDLRVSDEHRAKVRETLGENGGASDAPMEMTAEERAEKVSKAVAESATPAEWSAAADKKVEDAPAKRANDGGGEENGGEKVKE